MFKFFIVKERIKQIDVFTILYIIFNLVKKLHSFKKKELSFFENSEWFKYKNLYLKLFNSKYCPIPP